MTMRLVEPVVWYFPQPGERVNPADLKGAYCVGHCCEPKICDGDYCVINTKLPPTPGRYVVYQGKAGRLAKDSDGKLILSTNEGDTPIEGPIEGVVVQISRKVKHER